MTIETEDVVALLRGVTPKLAEELPGTASSRCQRGANLIQSLSERIAVLEGAVRDASDLLAERKHGHHARSPGHNARLVLEASLTKASPD